MNDPSQMMNRSFGVWQPSLPTALDDPMGFQNPRPVFAAGGAKPGRMNWKGKKAADKRKMAAAPPGAGALGGVVPGGGGAGGSGYKPPALKELQFQNRVKARRFYPKKKFTRFAPFAPRNTTSFIIRAKKAGGIASLVSPCAVTPAILPTPKFSPNREGLVDMAEECGVDGYGSMKGLIRLRSPSGHEIRPAGAGDDEEDLDDGSSESDVEEHLEVERRLDHDLSRFEMVYPGEEHSGPAAYSLENRVDDQDTHIAQLEEENLTLKEKLFLMEREMADMRRRLQLLETQCRDREENNKSCNNYNNVNNIDGSNNNEIIPSEEAASASASENIANEEASENERGGDVCSEKSAGDREEIRGGSEETPMRE